MQPSEAALRKLIRSLQRGESVTDQTNDELARAVQSPHFRADVVALGELETVVFKNTDSQGFDQYDVSSKTGFSAWRIKLAPDGKTAHLFLRVLEKPPEKPLTEAEFAAALEQRLMEQAAKDEFSGVVMVARGGKPVFQRAIGLADREQGIPNQIETKFRIGSMNKMFTAVSILQLVQAGKLSLSDPLAPSWQEHCFRFDELTQAGRWGEPLPAVAPAKAYSLAWSMRTPNADYDLWVDDVRLVCH